MKPIPTKPVPGFVAKVRGAFAKPAPDRELAEAPPSNDEIVRQHWRDILAAYMVGDDLDKIGKKLKPVAVSGAEIRRCLNADPELRRRLAQAKLELSHFLFDGCVRSAVKAEQTGQYNVSGALYLKAAGVLNKGDYGQKVVVGGDPENPIPITGNVGVSLAPDEAYRQLLEGGN